MNRKNVQSRTLSSSSSSPFVTPSRRPSSTVRPHSSLTDLSFSRALPHSPGSAFARLFPHSRPPLPPYPPHSRPPFHPPHHLHYSEQDLSFGGGRLKHPQQHVCPTKRSKSFSMFYWYLGNRSMDQQFPYYTEISEWLRFQPLSILQLDPADRIVLFIAVN
ncbi:hypothetical protein TYRP_013276 [Tyrophagus putrescentiae]|nr:hypothetical protein TYRP_013276 [Tyrophagus putrescentiae]